MSSALAPGRRVVVSEFAETPLEAVDHAMSLAPMEAPDASTLGPRDVIVAVNGEPVKAESAIEDLFHGTAGKETVVRVMRSPAAGEPRMELDASMARPRQSGARMSDDGRPTLPSSSASRTSRSTNASRSEPPSSGNLAA